MSKICKVIVISLIQPIFTLFAGQQQCPQLNTSAHRIGIGYEVEHGGCSDYKKRLNVSVKADANCNGGNGQLSQHCSTVSKSLDKQTLHFEDGLCKKKVIYTTNDGTLQVRDLTFDKCNFKPEPDDKPKA